ncbi:G-protein coupled receptor 35 [Cynocephalus volans]|uniref:G-protein coupled receptor 35 n=1 Tax=Cynocephalus volans TaxID=110931 RepID=UPI002FC61A51
MNDTCSPSGAPVWSPAVTHILYSYTGALLVLGLLLNGLALWVFCCRMQRWTETRVYMTNLAVADLCLVCSLPFMLYTLQHPSGVDTLFCQLSQAVYLTNRYLSISLVMAIAVDRYVAVKHPLCARRLRSPQQAAAVCAVLWVLVTVFLGLRWFLGVQEGGFCFTSRSRNFSTAVFSLLGFYLPLAVLVFCSLQVVTALARRPASGPAQAKATLKATRMVWANLVVFVVCFLPLHVVLTVQVPVGLHVHPGCGIPAALRSALLVTSKLSDANCCLDAVCYYYMAKEFQEAYAVAADPSAKARRGQDSLCVTVA